LDLAIATSQDGYKTGAFSHSIRVLNGFGSIVPKDLSSWFTDLDTDQDGHISLREWRHGGNRPIAQSRCCVDNGSARAGEETPVGAVPVLDQRGEETAGRLTTDGKSITCSGIIRVRRW
jgi:hypothetical protein